MMTISSLEKFVPLARLLHWASALVILWATFSGTYIAVFAVDDRLKHTIAEFNVAVTVAFIPVFLWRVLYRVHRGMPSYGATLSATNASAANWVHFAPYLLTGLVLFSGLLMMTRDIYVFNLLVLPKVFSDPNVADFFNRLHVYSSRFLGFLILVHVGAVLKHRHAGTPILQRMV